MQSDLAKLLNYIPEQVDDWVKMAYDALAQPILVVDGSFSWILYLNPACSVLNNPSVPCKVTDTFKSPLKNSKYVLLNDGRTFKSTVNALKQWYVITLQETMSRYESEYLELDHIGQGGFGHVFKAKNVLDGQDYAIKKIRVYDKENALREVKLLAMVSNHPNIVRYYHSWIEKDLSMERTVSGRKATSTLYMQMQLYPSSNLLQWLEQHPIDVNANLFVFYQLMLSLEHIHSFGVIHRDIKPENIFMDGLHLFLGDFGLATSEVVEPEGTLTYCAPEVLRSRPCTEKSDMYASGILLFELFTRFKTGMERALVITQLKKHAEFPKEFDFGLTENLIKSLVSERPQTRPNASTIIKDFLYVESDGFYSSPRTPTKLPTVRLTYSMEMTPSSLDVQSKRSCFDRLAASIK